MRKGPFTAEEDAIVLRRVAEWADKGQGIWKSLEIELGRPSNNVGNRYRKLVKTYSTTAVDGGIMVTPMDVALYVPVEKERKLAIALGLTGAEASSTAAATTSAAAAGAAAGSNNEAAIATMASLAPLTTIGKKHARTKSATVADEDADSDGR